LTRRPRRSAYWFHSSRVFVQCAPGTASLFFALFYQVKQQWRMVMPLFLPFLIGIPVVLGGGYLVYAVFH
jgi:hypothetical protein